MRPDIKYIDCKSMALDIKNDVKNRVKEFTKHFERKPILGIISVGSNPASEAYIRGKKNDCLECGIEWINIRRNEDVSEEDLIFDIQVLDTRIGADGIMVQLPIPNHLNVDRIINAIPPEKDVDGLTFMNGGKLLHKEHCLYPCTPSGCIEVLDRIGYNLSGKTVVIIGRSNIVGKPLALMMLDRDASVVICHSKTKNLVELCLTADVIVSATGNPDVLRYSMIPEKCIILDVGISRDENGKLCGDVRKDKLMTEYLSKVDGITPVPGGIGLMTRAMLMRNVIQAAEENELVKSLI